MNENKPFKTMRRKRVVSALLAIAMSISLVLPVSAEEDENDSINIIWLPDGYQLLDSWLYREITDQDDLIPVYTKEQNKYGFVNTSGETVVPLEYDQVRGFNDGLAVVLNRESWQSVDL